MSIQPVGQPADETAEPVRRRRTMADQAKNFGDKAPVPLVWTPLPHMLEWMENLEANGTSKGYMRVAILGLKHFAIFLETQGVQHPDEIRRFHILRFQTYLATHRKENGDLLALSYRQQLLKYVGSWLKWCAELEYLLNNPWVHIHVGGQVKKPKPLEDDEIALLFATHRQQAFSLPPFFFHRREVTLALLYGWGLRLHELQSLTCSAMDARLDWVTVRNKARHDSANRTKVLPYGSELKQVVTRWLFVRTTYSAFGEDALLIDRQGKPMTLHLIRKNITDLGARAGVAINPHRLRDTFGTTMLDNDVPVERIMKMMGHTTRAQTLAYARVNDPKLAESHEQVMTPLLNKLLGGELP